MTYKDGSFRKCTKAFCPSRDMPEASAALRPQYPAIFVMKDLYNGDNPKS